MAEKRGGGDPAAEDASSDERLRLLDELRQSEERFRLLVEGSQDFMSYRFRIVPDLQFEYVSAGVESILGYTPEDFYRDPEIWRRLVHPDDLAEVDKPLEETERPNTIRWRRVDGTYAWVSHRRVVLRNEYGEVVGLEGVAHDVTERKLAEEALLANERRFRSLVQNVSDLIVVV